MAKKLLPNPILMGQYFAYREMLSYLMGRVDVTMALLHVSKTVDKLGTQLVKQGFDMEEFKKAIREAQTKNAK